MLPADVTAEPFPHVVLDGLWSDALLSRVLLEFPFPGDQRWTRYQGSYEGGKGEQSNPERWGPATRTLYGNLQAIGPTLSDMFGLPPLTLDHVGGGYHHTGPGGRLGLHTDFNRHRGLYRRLNLLIFLNREWPQEAGGFLELHPDIEIAPLFNRTVIFETSVTSWHGHPVPVADGFERRSFAAYYFTKEPSDSYVGEQSTVWREGCSDA